MGPIISRGLAKKIFRDSCQLLMVIKTVFDYLTRPPGGTSASFGYYHLQKLLFQVIDIVKKKIRMLLCSRYNI